MDSNWIEKALSLVETAEPTSLAHALHLIDSVALTSDGGLRIRFNDVALAMIDREVEHECSVAH